MLTKKYILKNHLKQGVDYIRICGFNMKTGDSFIYGGNKVIIKEIFDDISFMDNNFEYWNIEMFNNYDFNCKCQLGGGENEFSKYSDRFKG